MQTNRFQCIVSIHAIQNLNMVQVRRTHGSIGEDGDASQRSMHAHTDTRSACGIQSWWWMTRNERQTTNKSIKLYGDDTKLCAQSR